ncbi:MAG: transposase [Anaerolineales bacterium]|uniref:IS200/IS605 family element transposase accessory protein TnpB n=1 Tax=Candidatus Desulfolinea nitratireducens TaxID=2841698 RepID=A0A8J6NPF6_9CHLR|nr:IS200/IS605 family element transposase accessory protein TnpB [Candidatus Desulfolinea nitratireducens]MBL6962078.1 transposase [Anaerolineales bacterium]
MIVRKGFKYRIYPNQEQQRKLAVQFGHARYIYNWGLGQSQDKYPGYNHLAKQLPILKKTSETTWLKEAHSQVLQQSLKDLDRAFQNFFAKRGGYPHFKSKRAKQSARYPQPKESWIAPDGRRIQLSKVGHVRLVLHRPLEGVMKNVTVSRTRSGRYFVSIQVEIEMATPIFAGGAVGLDLGLREFATLSTGEKIAPPQYYRKAQKKRRRLARQLSRKKLGGHNHEKARLRLARLDEKISNQRRDFHHKLSRMLVEENQFIGLEDLNVRGMLANHHLAKSIGDAGWSAFVTMLGYKGEWYGCQVEKVSRWYPSSKTCSVCGTKMEAMPLNVRIWQCPMCGTVHDRDVNAAINILKQSTAGAVENNAWGQSVRPSTDGYAGRTRKPTRFSGW